MISYEYAKRIAADYFTARGGMKLSQAFDAGDSWIFSARMDGRVAIGGGMVEVEKMSGMTAPFIPHVGNGFDVLAAAEEIPLCDGDAGDKS